MKEILKNKILAGFSEKNLLSFWRQFLKEPLTKFAGILDNHVENLAQKPQKLSYTISKKNQQKFSEHVFEKLQSEFLQEYVENLLGVSWEEIKTRLAGTNMEEYPQELLKENLKSLNGAIITEKFLQNFQETLGFQQCQEIPGDLPTVVLNGIFVETPEGIPG